jgi:DnaJ-domain-containing protein 1
VNLFGLAAGLLVGMMFFPWFGLLAPILGALAGVLLESVGRRPGAFGTETTQLVLRLYSLWGLIAGRNEVSDAQILFLRGVAGQLQITGPLARGAFEAFQQGRLSVEGLPWSAVLALTAGAAREIAEEHYLDRRTLLWIYASSRRLAALGTIRPGLVEQLDAIAQAFSLLDEVGTAGLGSSSQAQGDPYEQAWKNFKPGSSVAPEAYATLGLKPEADMDEIKKAYRSLVRRHHPDAHADRSEREKAQAAEQFLQVQQAYERIRRARNF